MMDETLRASPMATLPKPRSEKPVDKKRVQKFTKILHEYKSGKVQTEIRIKASENWWKLRNSLEEGADPEDDFRAVSGWLHNVIVAKHADAMDAYPEPVILPREMNDRAEAQKLSDIVPCVLEQNEFEETYSSAMWQKLKTGTGVYKAVWDQSKLNGLGDIAIEQCNLLNLYWKPGVRDIQKSPYFFHVELMDKDYLRERYAAELGSRSLGKTFTPTQFLYDDNVNTSDQASVIDVYYHKLVGGKNTLQYCRYVEDVVLYATENDPQWAERGLYDHGMYPYVFDPLFPIEGSPCGYGFVDLCKNPQKQIDLMNTAFVKNAMVGATPRYFSRGDGTINEEEFLDLSNPIVHTTGSLSEDYLRRIEHTGLDGTYVSLLDRTVQELRETTGNTETATGNTASGVTAASAIAALQEASGKGSRDSTRSSYRAYRRIVVLCIELIRQFYDMPRQFRIIGQHGAEEFVSYTSNNIQPVGQPVNPNDPNSARFYRLPIFDVAVAAQKKTAYTKVAQNELALQLCSMGFFNPNMTDQALMTLEMMEFDGKDEVLQKISQNQTYYDRMVKYFQLAYGLTLRVAPQHASEMMDDMSQVLGAERAQEMVGRVPASPVQMNPMSGSVLEEPSHVADARERAANASQPDGGGGI